jgi:hypothetical protein
MALQAAKPRDLIHMLDLFTFGAGLRTRWSTRKAT